jgi:hypothetical protein
MSDPSKPTADAPLISITLERSMLRVGVALITAVALLIIDGLGIASSPLVDAHPVVLSPERLALKTYLDTAGGWLQRFTEIEQQLSLLEMPPAIASATTPTATVIAASPIVTDADLVITVQPVIPLPTLAPPISWPRNLYDRAQQADRLVDDLTALDADQQNSEVPPALTALHTLVRSTLQAFARWSTAALDVIGAPTPDNVNALQISRATAQAALAEFRGALAAQRQETH